MSHDLWACSLPAGCCFKIKISLKRYQNKPVVYFWRVVVGHVTISVPSFSFRHNYWVIKSVLFTLFPTIWVNNKF